MKTVHALLIITACSVLISCRKNSTSPATTLLQNPTSYELVSESWTGIAPNGQTFLFTYDSAHLMTDYKQIQWGQGGINHTDSGDFQQPPWFDTTYFHLEYNNGMVNRKYIYEGGPQSVGQSHANNGYSQGYYEYEYNSKGWLTKAAAYGSDNQPANYNWLYSYNDMGQLTDMRENDGTKFHFHYTFAYDNKGNLIKEIDSSLDYNPALVYITAYSNYDNKVNYALTLNGYPFPSKDNVWPGGSVSPNNFGMEEWSGSMQPGGPLVLLSSTSYNYQYNDQGLPILIQSGGTTTTLQYRKYK